MVGFSKLCSNFAVSSYSPPTSPNKINNNSSSSTGSVSSSSSDLIFVTLSNEIEEALKKLTVINGKMNEIVNKENNSLNSSATVHTLQVIIKMTHFNYWKNLLKFLTMCKEASRYSPRLFTWIRKNKTKYNQLQRKGKTFFDIVKQPSKWVKS